MDKNHNTTKITKIIKKIPIKIYRKNLFPLKEKKIPNRYHELTRISPLKFKIYYQ